ncbi:MAG: hypothetical protein LQ340_004436 [Diploschistes diacapsis]|nr:MAG: hypothetical protein LQ340_004436 [Diploschistes diacapsis]
MSRHRRSTDVYERSRSRSADNKHGPRRKRRSLSPKNTEMDEDNAVRKRRYFSGRDRERPFNQDMDHGKEDRRQSLQQRSPGPETDDRRLRRRHSPHGAHHHRSHKSSPRSRSPRRHRRHRHYRRSPSASRSPPPVSRRAKAPLPSQQDAFTSKSAASPANAVAHPTEKQKPNYNASGKLAAETNTVAGTNIILKYNEPPEARKPSATHPWRMYEFKGASPDPLSTTELHARSCWLFGRERAVVDFPTEHPSCSKQHAVLQFRYVEKKSEFGDRMGGVRPYVIDLESANGTRVNGERIPDRRFWEVKSGDVLGFGESTREYVVMLPPKE